MKASLKGISWLLTKLARYFIIYKEYKESLEVIQIAEILSKGSLECCLLHSLSLTKLNLPLIKITKLKHYIKTFSHCPSILNELAVTFEVFDEHQKSMALYLQALDIDKYNPDSLNLLAAQVFYIGSPELSVLLYNKLLGRLY